ncbi:MAG: GIY-YIG nuclease family protein [bacterium]|nr:GIY-YIG nuclease family protein [bacterium]
MFYVYVLRSLKNNRNYIGTTNNLKRRLQEHNSGRSKYTSLTRPFKLIYFEAFNTRASAVQRELFLKSGKGREWLKNVSGRAVA